jgi:hypothetical protein
MIPLCLGFLVFEAGNGIIHDSNYICSLGHLDPDRGFFVVRVTAGPEYGINKATGALFARRFQFIELIPDYDRR